jgi:hypothetical protein
VTCEWDPIRNQPAHKAHAEATICVGRGMDNWHLCAACAALPRFKRFRKRVPLADARRKREDGK